MSQSFEYSGKWFIPSNAQRKVAGTLKFSPETGAVLELIGSFRRVAVENRVDAILNSDVVLGLTTNDQNVTLFDWVETNTTFDLPRPYTNTYARKSIISTDLVFVGAHFRNKDAAKFKSLTVSYSGLPEWLRFTGFTIQQPSIAEIIIAYKVPPSIEIARINDFRMTIGARATGKEPRYERLEANIKERTFVTFEFTRAKSYSECLKIVYQFAYFLTLAIGSPVYVVDMEGKTARSENVEIAFKREPQAGAKWLFSSQMLFTYEDAQDKFQTLLENWFKKAELLEPVYNLYFGTLYNPQMYLYHTFLSLAQAVETYHRRTNEGGVLPKPQYKARIATIIGDVPDEYKEWLKEKLAFSNERTLRERITSLIAVSTDSLKRIISDETDFIGKVVATRNYLTHYTKKTSKVVEGDELILVTHKLKLLVEECLLKEIGFENDDMDFLIAKSGAAVPQLL